MFAALKEFGAPLKDLSEKDFTEKGYFYQMGKPPFRLDIMMSIPGVTFKKAWKNRETVILEGLAISFISRDDLIRAKEVSGRPQDIIIDAENLRKAESIED